MSVVQLGVPTAGIRSRRTGSATNHRGARCGRCTAAGLGAPWRSPIGEVVEVRSDLVAPRFCPLAPVEPAQRSATRSDRHLHVTSPQQLLDLRTIDVLVVLTPFVTLPIPESPEPANAQQTAVRRRCASSSSPGSSSAMPTAHRVQVDAQERSWRRPAVSAGVTTTSRPVDACRRSARRRRLTRGISAST
jgi:hypothetical protein